LLEYCCCFQTFFAAAVVQQYSLENVINFSISDPAANVPDLVIDDRLTIVRLTNRIAAAQLLFCFYYAIKSVYRYINLALVEELGFGVLIIL